MIRRSVALGTTLMLLTCWAPRAEAKGPLVHAFAFNCTVTLAVYPSLPKVANPSPCVGNASGTFSGIEELPDAGDVVTAIAVNAAFSMTVRHDELCFDGAPPIASFWNGRFLIAPIVVVDDGQVFSDGVLTASYDLTAIPAALMEDGKLATKDAPLQTQLSWNGGTEFAKDAIGSLGVVAYIPQLGPGNVCPAGAPLTVTLIGSDTGM
jgi:hypothetical protein